MGWGAMGNGFTHEWVTFHAAQRVDVAFSLRGWKGKEKLEKLLNKRALQLAKTSNAARHIPKKCARHRSRATMCDHIHNVKKTQLGLMNIEVAVRRKDRARDIDDKYKPWSRYILTPL
jgi:hypothetical protein